MLVFRSRVGTLPLPASFGDFSRANLLENVKMSCWMGSRTVFPLCLSSIMCSGGFSLDSGVTIFCVELEGGLALVNQALGGFDWGLNPWFL